MKVPVRMGIVGLGRIADLHAKAYRHCDLARLHAVCDLDETLARRRASEWGARRVYTDYRALLADPEVDAVEILTPHHLHREMAIAACRAGKHVSVQKPMALSVEDCDRMIEAARASGVVLRVYENNVFYPPHVKAKAWIQDGAIGEPLSIRLRMAAGGKGGWHIPLRSWLWRLNEQTCGGGPTIFDDGYHKFSMALHLLGPVETVHAWIDRSFGVIDAPAVITFRYADRRAVGLIEATVSPQMFVRSRYYPVDERIEVTGTVGVLWVTRCAGRLLEEPPLLLYRDGEVRACEALRADWLDSFIDATCHFARSLIHGEPPMLSGEQGREVTRFALAALRSAERGEPVCVADVT